MKIGQSKCIFFLNDIADLGVAKDYYPNYSY